MICTIVDIRGDYAYVKYQDINNGTDHGNLLVIG